MGLLARNQAETDHQAAIPCALSITSWLPSSAGSSEIMHANAPTMRLCPEPHSFSGPRAKAPFRGLCGVLTELAPLGMRPAYRITGAMVDACAVSQPNEVAHSKNPSVVKALSTEPGRLEEALADPALGARLGGTTANAKGLRCCICYGQRWEHTSFSVCVP